MLSTRMIVGLTWLKLKKVLSAAKGLWPFTHSAVDAPRRNRGAVQSLSEAGRRAARLRNANIINLCAAALARAVTRLPVTRTPPRSAINQPSA